MMDINIADKYVQPINNKCMKMLAGVATKFNVKAAPYLEETIKGHIINFECAHAGGAIDPGKPMRMDKETLEYFAALPGFRWVECCTDTIRLGFDRYAFEENQES